MDDHVAIPDSTQAREPSATGDERSATAITSGAMPISAMLQGECLEITLRADAERCGSLLAEGGHRWLECIGATCIRVDLALIANLSSPLAAWLGTVTAFGLPVTLSGASRRVTVQLQLLGLGKICHLEP